MSGTFEGDVSQLDPLLGDADHRQGTSLPCVMDGYRRKQRIFLLFDSKYLAGPQVHRVRAVGQHSERHVEVEGGAVDDDVVGVLREVLVETGDRTPCDTFRLGLGFRCRFRFS